jgi:hypothetical protein
MKQLVLVIALLLFNRLISEPVICAECDVTATSFFGFAWTVSVSRRLTSRRDDDIKIDTIYVFLYLWFNDAVNSLD